MNFEHRKRQQMLDPAPPWWSTPTWEMRDGGFIPSLSLLFWGPGASVFPSLGLVLPLSKRRPLDCPFFYMPCPGESLEVWLADRLDLPEEHEVFFHPRLWLIDYLPEIETDRPSMALVIAGHSWDGW